MGKRLVTFKVTKTSSFLVDVLAESDAEALAKLEEAKGQYGILVSTEILIDVTFEKKGSKPWVSNKS